MSPVFGAQGGRVLFVPLSVSYWNAWRYNGGSAETKKAMKANGQNVPKCPRFFEWEEGKKLAQTCANSPFRVANGPCFVKSGSRSSRTSARAVSSLVACCYQNWKDPMQSERSIGLIKGRFGGPAVISRYSSSLQTMAQTKHDPPCAPKTGDI
jgi:hypothetical protein